MLSSLPWDVTAGVLIAREAGPRPSTTADRPWSYRSTFTICCTPGVADELLPLVQEAVEAADARGRLRPIGLKRIDPDLLGQARDLAQVAGPEPVPGDVEGPAATPSFTATSTGSPPPMPTPIPANSESPAPCSSTGAKCGLVHFQLPLVGQQDRRLRGSRYEDVRRALLAEPASDVERSPADLWSSAVHRATRSSSLTLRKSTPPRSAAVSGSPLRSASDQAAVRP